MSYANIELVRVLLADLHLHFSWRLDPATQEPRTAVVHRGNESGDVVVVIDADPAGYHTIGIRRDGTWFETPLAAADAIRAHLTLTEED